jgi:hypothetical protein
VPLACVGIKLRAELGETVVGHSVGLAVVGKSVGAAVVGEGVGSIVGMGEGKRDGIAVGWVSGTVVGS